MDTRVYDNYLGGEIILHSNAYEVLVGPWRTMITVENDNWLEAHDKANNWRLRKAEKFKSLLERRTSVPFSREVLPSLLKAGYGVFIRAEELDDDYVLEKTQFLPGRTSAFWTSDDQTSMADETHRMHAANTLYAATEWGAISGRSLEVLAEMYNRTDIGNLAYMAQHAPEPYGSQFHDLHKRLTGFVASLEI